jgi:hypothetical protein
MAVGIRDEPGFRAGSAKTHFGVSQRDSADYSAVCQSMTSLPLILSRLFPQAKTLYVWRGPAQHPDDFAALTPGYVSRVLHTACTSTATLSIINILAALPAPSERERRCAETNPLASSRGGSCRV